MLYNPGGSPAVNAKVCFFPNDFNPQTGQGSGAADSTTTDANGNYAITLDSGTYNILADGDSGLAFQDSVKAMRGSTVHPSACTLKTPGTIRGVVQLEQGGDPRTVIILFMGTHSYTTADAAGNFTSEHMAKGEYRVRFLTTLSDYEVLDTELTVISGTLNVLPQPIVLKYTGIPTPENLIVTYDTLNETVILSWDLPDTALISGYNVYRSIRGYNFSLVTPMPLPETQTVFYDTGVAVGNVYEYRVVSRTSSGEQSKMIDYDADTVLVVSRSLVTTTFVWNAPDTGSIYDTVPVIISFSNPTRRVDQLAWYVDTAQMPVRTRNNSSLSGSDTLEYICSSRPGPVRFIVKATDNAGTVWCDTFGLQVIQDAPVPNAGQDTTVSINDTVRLHSFATQWFGTIVEWAWDIGNTGTFITTSGSDTAIVISASEEMNYLCVVRVRDDDGNEAKDTVKIIVHQDTPMANAGNDTVVSNGDTVHLQGSKSTDGFGKIVKYEWDIGNAGNFVICITGDTIISLPDSINFDSVKCVLRVTDDDDNISLDTVVVYVNISVSYSLVKATDNALFSGRTRHGVVAFGNKLWVIGGWGHDAFAADTFYNDVWFSSDGQNWEMATSNAGFEPRGGFGIVVFNNKIWILGGGGKERGFGDVWSSADGYIWQKVKDTAEFGIRGGFGTTVFDNKIWVIGGYDSSALGDVWYSIDGYIWEKAAENTPFGKRYTPGLTVSQNKLWVMGGQYVLFPNDIWNSQNGTTWFCAVSQASFSGRYDHQFIEFGGKLWIIAGWQGGPLSDVWYSNDGIQWDRAPQNPLFCAREGHRAVVYNNRLWIIGGMGGTGTGFLNDVWYYSK
ncbi:MAG: hypothetical protein JW699_02205 [Chitinispirillaceae bacterium]|nr:hypothetical protein [Chitinispirillaceae bacterium]